MNRPTRSLTGAIVTLLALLLLAGAAGSAKADVPTADAFAPSVWSDKADYGPGETVQLSGSNWQADESVPLRGNDDPGSTWSRDVDVTADQYGAISDSFQLPDWFVAQYRVTATGASGSTASYSFTDGNVKVAVAGLAGTSTAGITETLYSGAGCTGGIVAGTNHNPHPTPASSPQTHTGGDGASPALAADSPPNDGGQSLHSLLPP